jgi:hypothetical protein
MSGYNLKLSATPIHQSSEVRPQNIYITNDEDIKEGDLVYCRTENRVLVSNVSYSKLEDRFKIILTTDPKLIADGVQAITNTFAEWFVKNPSCEEVEVQCRYNFYVGQDLTHYKIIIPKEEQPKQETLEEAAEINYKKLYEGEPLTQDVPIDAFKQGAYWQKERSYSEEDMSLAFETGRNFQLTGENNFVELIEQFKKK